MSTIFVDNIKTVSGTDTFKDGQFGGTVNSSATLSSGLTFAGTTTGTHSGASTGAHSGTIASGVALPASHITIGGSQSGMTTRNGVLKWGDSQIGSVTGSVFSIDNTGSATKIVMETNGIIMIVWQGISNNVQYWRINKNTTSSASSESTNGMAYSYQTHGQVSYHGYASEDDYFCCESSSDLQNTTDKCFCSIVGFKIA